MSDDWKDEAFAAYVANLKRQDAIEKQRRKERGEIEIILEQAADEPPISDKETQQQLSQFGIGLRTENLHFSQRALALDAVDAHGYPLAEFVLKDLGVPAVTAVATLAGVWINARLGRKVRVKAGEIEAEASTVEEAERLLAIAVKAAASSRTALSAPPADGPDGGSDEDNC